MLKECDRALCARYFTALKKLGVVVGKPKPMPGWFYGNSWDGMYGVVPVIISYAAYATDIGQLIVTRHGALQWMINLDCPDGVKRRRYISGKIVAHVNILA